MRFFWVNILKKLKDCYLRKNKLDSKQITCYLKLFAFSLIIILVVMIIWKVFNNNEKAFALISALAILVSALLASYSVILNIENTNKNEELKRENDKETNIIFLIQNLNDLLSVITPYKDIDIGALKVNTHNTLLAVLERKLSFIEDKLIIKYLSNEEINYLTIIRLKLYESIGILYNYTQGIIVDDPERFNSNIKFIIEKLDLLILLIAKNNNIVIQKYGE